MPSRRWVGRAGALLLIYLIVSLAVADHGHLGTDTGAKIATLETMVDSDELDVDVGYWAERDDPAGALHPLYQTAKRGDRWIAVTTLPLMIAAAPLYRAGGYHLALLIPAAASVVVAVLAGALARRIGTDDVKAFWIVGLASPAAVYALDLWEHSLGLALMVGAAVIAVDVAMGRDAPRASFFVGLLAGAAFSLRTEAVVYGFVLVGGALVARLRRDALRLVVAGGVMAVIGLAVAVALNHALEELVVGQGIRLSRASDLAATAGETTGVGSTEGSRIADAVTTTINVYAKSNAAAWVAGGGVCIALATIVHRTRRSQHDEGNVSRLLAAIVAAIYAIVFARGLGFVPGLFAAAPIAIVAIVLAWTDLRTRIVSGMALGALPLVWAVQYTGGAEPQWGGRYVLVSSVLLTVVGISRLGELRPWAARTFVLLAAAVTACGVGWVVDRSYRVERLEHAIAGLDEDLVVISTMDHLLREAGAVYEPERRWLTAVGDAEVDLALDVVKSIGADRFALVLHPRQEGFEPRIAGFAVTDRLELPTLSGDAPVLVYSTG